MKEDLQSNCSLDLDYFKIFSMDSFPLPVIN